jgi:hypothetical protein
VSEDARHDENRTCATSTRATSFHRFALAQAEFLRRKIERVAAELIHPDIERDARAQAGLSKTIASVRQASVSRWR